MDLMHIVVPDEHPGRCRNTRTVWSGCQPHTLRCLDYEGTRHVCDFPAPPKPADSVTWNATVDPKPEPWVKPASSGREAQS